MALASANDLKKAPYATSDNAGHLNELSQRVNGLTISADVLGAITAATLGVALFVTLRKVEVRAGPQSLALAGRF
jgi:hypothetical protein